MFLFVSVLFGIQALCSWAAPPPLLSPACDDTAVEDAADLALRQINADRKEGYIFKLNRIFSAREHPQETSGSVFYLILDVIDSECHVLSKMLWKNCMARPAHTTVYGQCKAIIYINQARNIAHLNSYECTLQPVPPRYISRICPDCPLDDNPNDPRYTEAALQSLAKFNEESDQTHYFSVLNVTRASMQWVIGPAYFVEFLIQETSCSKSDKIADISKCKPLSPELAKIGFCKGSVGNSHLEHQRFVTISCEIYGPQDPATEEGTAQADQKQEASSQHHQAAFSSETSHFSPHLGKAVGWVAILPPSTEDISFQSQPEGQNEHKVGKPVPPEAAESVPSFDEEKTQVDKPDLTEPFSRPVILPFPEEFSLSDSCPGEVKESSSILQPLLPKKPTKI